MFTSGHASLHYSFTSPLLGYTSPASSNLFSSWQVGNWSDCSVECGEGSQGRQVKCVDRHGVSVSEGMCKPITKPVNTMSCTRPACEQYHWTVGNWSEVCFLTHRQTNRQMYYAYSSHAVQTCMTMTNYTVTLQKLVYKLTITFVQLTQCCIFIFQCSVSCGSGTQSRVVQCHNTNSQQLVADSYCSNIPAPTRMRNCSLLQCSVWVYKPWSQVCRINRYPHHIQHTNTIYFYLSFFTFLSSPLSPLQCSVSCGNGVKEQRPVCESVPGGVASTSCDPTQQPPVLHQNCSSSPCVTPPTSSESTINSKSYNIATSSFSIPRL